MPSTLGTGFQLEDKLVLSESNVIMVDDSVLYSGNLLSRSEAFPTKKKKKKMWGVVIEVMGGLVNLRVGTLSQPVCMYNSPPRPIHRRTFQDPR